MSRFIWYIGHPKTRSLYFFFILSHFFLAIRGSDCHYDPPTHQDLYYSQLTTKQNETLVLTNAVNGRHLRVGTYNNYPLSWVETVNDTIVGHGVAFVLLEILKNRFNFTFEVVIPEKNYEYGGRRPEDSLLGLVSSSKVDMAAAFLPVFAKFYSNVKYSSDLDEGLWMMMLKRPKESAAGAGLLAPFATYVWYITLAAVVLYGPCITILTRLRSKLIPDDEKHISLSPSYWFVYSSFIKQGTSLAPDANTTRVLFATWWLFIILLSSFYTANLTAFLTLSKFTLDIEYPKDLYKKNYRWVATAGSAVEYAVKDPDDDLYYLNKMVVNGRSQFRSVTDFEDILTYVTGGAVFVKEQIAIDSLMYGDYLTKAREGVEEEDRCTYVVAPNEFMKQRRAFAYPKNSSLNVIFDKILVHLVQSGIVKFLEHIDLPRTKICPLDLQSKDRQLRNSDLMMTYMIMATGLAAAIAIFVGEVFFKRYMQKKYNEEDLPKPKRLKKGKNIAGNTLEENRPPPYEALFGKRTRPKVNSNSEKKIINGREYWVVNTENGDTRLIPVRTPSAFLYR